MRTSKDVLILARTIYGEARGEGERGMQAVANVIMNRVAANSWYGDGVQGVCLKDKQFSAWNENDPNSAIIANMEAGIDQTFDVALEVAQAAFDGTMGELTGGVRH